MTYRKSALGLLRAVRDALARLNGLLAEAANSDEDLVFRIRYPESERLDRNREPPLARGYEHRSLSGKTARNTNSAGGPP
jgi:hypothetical protein